MIGLAGGDIGVTDQQSLVVFTSPAPAIGFELHYVGSWVEFNDLDPGSNSTDIRSKIGLLDNAAIQDLVPYPSAGRQRQVKFVSIHNPHVSNTQLVQVFIRTLTLDRFMLQVSLGPLQTLIYVDTEGWYVIDVTSGAIVTTDTNQQTSRLLLSGSTSGRPIAVAATATPGTLIHTAVTGTVSFDEIWLWVTNRTGAAATLTIEWGGTGTGDQLTQALSIPANSNPILVVQGEVLNNGLVVRAFSGTANALNISGYVNRIV